MMSRRRFAGWLAGLAGLAAGKGWGMSRRRSCPDPYPRWSLRRRGDDFEVTVDGVPSVPYDLIEPALLCVNDARFLDLAGEPGQLMMHGCAAWANPLGTITLVYRFRYRREGWGKEVMRDGTIRDIADAGGNLLRPRFDFHTLPYMPAERTMP